MLRSFISRSFLSKGLLFIFFIFIYNPTMAMPLSSGDRLKLDISGGKEFSGTYYINTNGEIELPYIKPIPIEGISVEEAKKNIENELISAQIFRENSISISLSVISWAPILISVEGEVFLPGSIRINEPESNLSKIGTAEPDAPGASLPLRFLSQALAKAGGITPFSNLEKIRVIRNKKEIIHDLKSFMYGGEIHDIPLINGDRVIVERNAKQDPFIARPSKLSPPGIKIHISPISIPGLSETGTKFDSSGISIPFGSRLSQGLTAANCNAGTDLANSLRFVQLIRTNRLTGETQNWTFRINTVLSAKGESANLEVNPILYEGDMVICHDRGLSALRDLFRSIADLLTPFSIWNTL